MPDRVKRPLRTLAAALALVATAVIVASCGGAEGQDEDEPEGTWNIDILSASFPGRQRLADQAELKIRVKNVDQRAVPNMSVTVDGFNIRRDDAGLSDPARPIWVVEEGPDNASTAFTNTWAAGEVEPDETHTFIWKVSAVRAGTYTLRFRVGAGVDGRAKARLPDGSPATGSFIARVSEKPHPVDVD